MERNSDGSVTLDQQEFETLEKLIKAAQRDERFRALEAMSTQQAPRPEHVE